MKIPYRYKEFIRELNYDLDDKKVSLDDIVMVLKRTKEDDNDFPPRYKEDKEIIDWFYKASCYKQNSTSLGDYVSSFEEALDTMTIRDLMTELLGEKEL